MKNALKPLAIIVLALGTGACSTTPVPAERKIRVESQWVRSSFNTETLGPRRTYAMNPLVTEEQVFQGNPADGFVAFHRIKGSELWRLKIQNGVVSGAQLAKDLLYFGGNDGFFYCVKAHSGEVVWTFPTRSENLASPLVHEGLVYFLAGNSTLYALNAENGKQVWAYSRAATTPISIRGGTQPAVHGSLILAGFSDGYFVALNRKDGALAWERQLNQNPRFRDVDSSPVIDGETVFVSGYDSSLYALSIRDGQIVWRFEEGGFSPVTVKGDRVFLAGSQGRVFCLDKKSGKLLWTHNLKAGVASQPIVLQNLLVFGESEGPIRFLKADSGQLVHSYHTGRGVISRPFADEKTGEVIVMSTEGNLHSLKVTWPRAEAELPWLRLTQ